MNPEIQQMNEIISKDNDLTEESINKIKEALIRLNENMTSIKGYLNKQKIQIQNPHAQNFLIKIENYINTTEQTNNKAIIKIDQETKKEDTKIYTSLYLDPEENKTE